MKFTGYLCDKYFDTPTEAESPTELYLIWKSKDDPPVETLRCWVQTKSESRSWAEILLDLPGYFEKLEGYFGEESVVDFRIKGKSSPNSSPHPSPSKDSTAEETVGLSETFSTLDVDASGSTAGSIDFSELINDKDPFTQDDVRLIEDPVLLRFDCGKKISDDIYTLCMSAASLDKFIHMEADAGKNLIDLEMTRIACKDGQERNFRLTQGVWMLSLLEISQQARNYFRDYLVSTIRRALKIEKLQKDEDLWARVCFWVSDFLDFRSGQERLSVPPEEDDITPFMSPFYFSTAEAKYLGDLSMPNTISLRDTIVIMLEEKGSQGLLEVCASHDIALALLIGFDLKKGFHKSDKFKKDKKAWIKKREKAINSTKR